MFLSPISSKGYGSLKSASDETLDALYSFHCLGIDCYIIHGVWKDCELDHVIPKYCKAYGRNYIEEKIKRVFKKNGNL